MEEKKLINLVERGFTYQLVFYFKGDRRTVRSELRIDIKAFWFITRMTLYNIVFTYLRENFILPAPFGIRKLNY